MKKLLFSVGLCLFLSPVLLAQEVISIEEAKIQGEGAVVTVKGIVTTGAEIQSSLRYFQDETHGMTLYFPSGSEDFKGLDRGDSIKVTGQLVKFRGLWEVDKTANEAAFNLEVLSKGNELPPPDTILVSEFSDRYQGRLIALEDALVTDERSIFEGGGSQGNFAIEDNAGNETVLRIPYSSHELHGKAVPRGNITAIGVLGIYYDTWQLIPRDRQDIIAGLEIKGLTQTNIGRNRMDFTWTTPLPASTVVRYKKHDEPAEAFDTLVVDGMRQEHSIMLSGLAPAEFYEVEVYSITADEKKAQSPSTLYSTISESTGEINVFFNYLPEGTPEAIVVDQEHYIPGGFAAKIAEYIDKANYSIDVAIYNVNEGGSEIINALNRAQARGVSVRYITDPGANSYGRANLQNIPSSVCSCPENENGPSPIMHNKFVVVDPVSAQNSYVLTGSANWTSNNLNDDPNDLLIIQDQALAKAYQLEFNEMWGSEGATPNPDEAAFGADKIFNTPSKFIIGGKLVELYFSPSDGTNNKIIEAIQTTNSDVRFALADLTRDDIASVLIAEDSIGWSVKGLIENDGDASSLVLGRFANYSMEVHDTEFKLHHKFVVVDALRQESDPQVLTGSHNWSTNADLRNDENTLIIHDGTIAMAFFNHWRILNYTASGTIEGILTGGKELEITKQLRFYPNPANGRLTVDLSMADAAVSLSLMSSTGQVVSSRVAQKGSQTFFDLSGVKPGVYLLTARSASFNSTYKILVK